MSSLTKTPLAVLSIALLLVLLPGSIFAKPSHGRSGPSPLTYHGGPLLTGKINLRILWYGQFGKVHKTALQSFIKSLNYKSQVSQWWGLVESYQTQTNKASRKPKITVRVANQVTDTSFSSGKVLTNDFIKPLVQKTSGGGKADSIVVIFAARDVTVVGSCLDQCSLHGVIGKTPYIVVGNPESECPEKCAWAFSQGTFHPPTGDIGADAMVMNFASALAQTVTNPFSSGFFGKEYTNPSEASTACPSSAFNAKGLKWKNFVLPALWNPKTSSCWTLS